MNNTKNILIILLSLNCLFVYSQHKSKEANLVQLNISNNDFDSTLDSIISQEKKCSYYSCDLIFGITLNKRNQDTYLIIDSLLDENIALGLNPYGYFYYRRHLFFVDGDIASELLGKTKK